MSVLDEFINAVTAKIGCGYVYGSQGEIMTQARLDQLIGQYGISHYKSAGKDASKWIGKQCFDCSGLVIWTLQQLKLLKPSEDYTANNIYQMLCVPVDKANLQKGDLCFVNDAAKKTIVHVGVFIGENQVVHARGTVYGVVKTGMLPYFGVFGRLKYLDELKKALDFISSKSGIDTAYWYKQAQQVKYLNECFVKIAKGFGGL